jgi:hypothetical protein
MAIGRLSAAARFVFAMAATAIAPLGLASAEETTPPQTAAKPAGLTIVLEHVPADTPKDASIYVAGSFNPKADNLPEYRLIPDGHGRYTITLPASVRGPIGFKFMLGSPKIMEVDATGSTIPARHFTVPETGAATYTGSVAAWPIHTPEAWRKAAATDLTAMHDMLRDNAPQMFVERDSAHFRKWLETGYAEAQAKLPSMQDYNGYAYLLRGYAGGFRDGHLGIVPNPEHLVVSGRPQQWPGFATRWADGAYVVSMNSASAKDPLPPVGAKLLDCDGKSAEVVARSRLDMYDGNLDLYQDRDRSALFLLWDEGNPFVESLKTCRFQEASGIKTYPLSYRPIDRKERVFTKPPKARFGLEHPAPKVWRIGVPEMKGESDWPRLYADIEAHVNDIRNSDRLIIDLRGNGGGNSQFAGELAKRLWGEAVAGHYMPFWGPMVYPAVSGTRQYIAETTIPELRKLSQAGKIQQGAVAAKEQFLALLDKAIAEGRKTITVGQQTEPERGPVPANPMKAQVFLVTDHACFSACLDLMDLFLAIPNVYHAGTQTGADTIFMELERHKLPSGMAVLAYGHHALIKRPRGSNVPYTPASALTYRGDLADEAAFERWLTALPAQKSH